MHPEKSIYYGTGDKLAWLEAVASDRKATAFDVRVSVALSNRIDKYNGRAVISQMWLANFVGGTDRGVRASAERLERLGYLSVERTEITNGKGRHFGGRGKSNVYVPIKVKNKTRNGNSTPAPENPEQQNTKTWNEAARNPEPASAKPGTAVPPLPNIYLNSSCSISQLDGVADEDGRWKSVKDDLLKHGVTQAECTSWIDRLKFEGIEEDTAVLLAPTNFIRDSISQSTMYGHLKRAWQRLLPFITRVDIRTTKRIAAE